MPIHTMQNLCRSTLKHLSSQIVPGMSLREIRALCEEYMLKNGADSFWYWNVGAFVFSGKETALSVSGTDYHTSDNIVGENDIITVDLSPQCNNVWGDYARTVIIENGNVVSRIESIENREWKHGLVTEDELHGFMKDFVTPDTTFEELFFAANEQIRRLGYVNLDFCGNLGHSIVRDKKDRIYIEKGNSAKLSSVDAFTFEPHIGKINAFFGYKKENIYCFDGSVLVEL